MCDPIGIIGLGLSIGMAVANYSAQQEMMANQQAANDQWLSYQQQKARQENMRQMEARQRADAARQGTLTELEANKQKKAQVDEEQRLGEKITPDDMLDQNPELIGDKLLSGQQNMAQTVGEDFKNRVTDASRDARKRIAALATIQSYGGSQNSIAQRADDLFRKSMQDIRLQGDIRQGSLAAYGAEKQVQPIQYTMSGGGGGGGGGLGNQLAGAIGRGIGGQLAQA